MAPRPMATAAAAAMRTGTATRVTAAMAPARGMVGIRARPTGAATAAAATPVAAAATSSPAGSPAARIAAVTSAAPMGAPRAVAAARPLGPHGADGRRQDRRRKDRRRKDRKRTAGSCRISKGAARPPGTSSNRGARGHASRTARAVLVPGESAVPAAGESAPRTGLPRALAQGPASALPADMADRASTGPKERRAGGRQVNGRHRTSALGMVGAGTVGAGAATAGAAAATAGAAVLAGTAGCPARVAGGVTGP
jgi:hypothetical protein